jgi:hypothetical protein
VPPNEPNPVTEAIRRFQLNRRGADAAPNQVVDDIDAFFRKDSAEAIRKN